MLMRSRSVAGLRVNELCQSRPSSSRAFRIALGDLRTDRAAAHRSPRASAAIVAVAGRKRNDVVLVSSKSRALGEIAAFILAAFAEQVLHACNRRARSSLSIARSTVSRCPHFRRRQVRSLQHPIEHLAVVHLHHIGAAGNAERFHRVRRHHAHLGIGRRRRAAHRVGIELHELAEAAGTGLLVAVDVADAIAAIGLWQRVEILGDIARQRRGQVVAQRNPLLVVVLEREHALVRPVLVGQEFAERVGVFHRRRFHRLEAVALVDVADFLDHLRASP